MNKVLRIGTIQVGGRRASVYVKAEFEDEKFSVSGVVEPLPSGNALGGCGQINMEFWHKNPKHNDKRYDDPIKPSDINFAPGWDSHKWLKLLEVWEEWHLNDMQSACEHQKELGWTYEDHHDPKTYKGEKCPVCGYEIGSQWLKKKVPDEVIEFIKALPDADKIPAWV